MKAMVLAAGLGTRLRPLTNDRPKALVEVNGRTLLEITIERLRNSGVHEAIVNVHHFADDVVDYLKSKQNFGMRIEISREDALLDTGGGLKKARWFFVEHANPGAAYNSEVDAFILHNVDVLSTIDVGRMLRFHSEHGALATLAVQRRETSRYLLFNKNNLLCGRRSGNETLTEPTSLASRVTALGFSGIHVISPRIFTLMKEDGAFSIIDCYLRLAAEGEKILAFPADEYYWRDLGRPRDITQAEKDLAKRSS